MPTVAPPPAREPLMAVFLRLAADNTAHWDAFVAGALGVRTLDRALAAERTPRSARECAALADHYGVDGTLLWWLIRSDAEAAA